METPKSRAGGNLSLVLVPVTGKQQWPWIWEMKAYTRGVVEWSWGLKRVRGKGGGGYGGLGLRQLVRASDGTAICFVLLKNWPYRLECPIWIPAQKRFWGE